MDSLIQHESIGTKRTIMATLAEIIKVAPPTVKTVLKNTPYVGKTFLETIKTIRETNKRIRQETVDNLVVKIEDAYKLVTPNAFVPIWESMYLGPVLCNLQTPTPLSETSYKKETSHRVVLVDKQIMKRDGGVKSRLLVQDSTRFKNIYTSADVSGTDVFTICNLTLRNNELLGGLS